MSIPSKHARGYAFSLTEMLVVIAIIGILFALVVPAIKNMTGSKGIVKAMNGTYGMLEFARNEAQNRETYVWVGFANGTNISSKNSEAQIVAIASLDGTINIASNNITNLSRIERFDSIQYSPIGGTNNVMNNSSTAFTTGANSFARCLVFSPAGQVLTSAGTTNAYTDQASVILVSVTGTSTTSKSLKGVIDIAGATGTMRMETITNQ